MTCKADEKRFSWLHRSNPPRLRNQNLLRAAQSKLSRALRLRVFVCFSSREIYLINDCLAYLCFGNLHFIELVIKIWLIVQPSSNLFALKISILNVVLLATDIGGIDIFVFRATREEKRELLWIIISLLWLARPERAERARRKTRKITKINL